MRKNLIVVKLLMFLGVTSFNLEGMVRFSIEEREVGRLPKSDVSLENFEMAGSLCDWPKVSSLTSREKEFFKNTWEKKKSLSENQVNLVAKFKETCCDFSIKVQEVGLNGVCLGITDDGDKFLFKGASIGFQESFDLSEVLVFGDEEQGSIRAGYFDSVISDVTPFGMQDWMICEFDRYIQRFVEDSVGCEILRTAIAKYDASGGDLSRIVFIPIEKGKYKLAYTNGSYVWKYVKRREDERKRYANLSKRRRIILFSSEWFNEDNEGLIVQLNQRRWSSMDIPGLRKFQVYLSVIPKEAELLYYIIYATNVVDNKEYVRSANNKTIIEKRSKGKYFCGCSEEVGCFSVLDKILNFSIFQDDKSYRTMYGLTRKGVAMVNESSYLAHRYNLIRATHLGSNTNLRINGKKLSVHETYKILKQYIVDFGDYDLYKYYLSSGSNIRYPEFGVGKYQYTEE